MGNGESAGPIETVSKAATAFIQSLAPTSYCNIETDYLWWNVFGQPPQEIICRRWSRPPAGAKVAFRGNVPELTRRLIPNPPYAEIPI